MSRRFFALLLLPASLTACHDADEAPMSLPPAMVGVGPQHLEVTFDEPTNFAMLRLRAESCNGVEGPWRGRITAEGAIVGQSEINFNLTGGAPGTLDVKLPVTGAIDGNASGRLRVTPTSYASPIEGEPPTHQLRVSGGLTVSTPDGDNTVPAMDQFLTARPLQDACNR